MTNLPDSGTRRKSAHVENPRRFSDRPKPPPWLRPMPNDGALDVLDRLIDAGASNKTLKLWRYYCKACQRYEQPCTWEGRKRIEDATGLKESTLRVAREWLEERGYLGTSEELIRGRWEVVTWCLWLLPSGQVDAEEFVLGGIPARIVPPRFRPKSADPCAHESAPQYRTGSVDPDSKKTTDSGASSSFVQVAKEGRPKAPPAPPAATAELPEPVAAAIAAIEDESIRTRATELAPAWVADHGVERTWKLLVAIRAKLASSDPVISRLDRWASKIFANWSKTGKATGKAVAAEEDRRAAEAKARARAEAEAKARAAKRASEEWQALQAERESLWRSLSEADQAPLRAEYERVNPRPTARADSGPAKFWARAREMWCSDTYAFRVSGHNQ